MSKRLSDEHATWVSMIACHQVRAFSAQTPVGHAPTAFASFLSLPAGLLDAAYAETRFRNAGRLRRSREACGVASGLASVVTISYSPRRLASVPCQGPTRVSSEPGFPQQFLNFLPLPQGHVLFLPTLRRLLFPAPMPLLATPPLMPPAVSGNRVSGFLSSCRASLRRLALNPRRLAEGPARFDLIRQARRMSLRGTNAIASRIPRTFSESAP